MSAILKKIITVVSGSAVAAYGMDLAIHAGFGGATLSVLWKGISLKTGMSLGTASFLVAVVMVIVSFIGDRLVGRDGCYTLAEDQALWDTLHEVCEKAAAKAEENVALLAAQEDGKDVFYEDKDKWWMMRCAHTEVEPVGAPEGPWQNTRTTFSFTNTGEHIIMSAKLKLTYLDSNGYVIADVPFDLDCNASPILLSEVREVIFDQRVYNTAPDGEVDLGGIIVRVVSVNAPNEAGH